MAILNYGNQFKYSGKGYVDSKMAPVNTFDELEKNVGVLSSLYTPGMKVMVLNDDLFGPTEYFLNEDYEWKRIIDLNGLSFSLDKGNYDTDSKDEMYLQLHYTNANGELVALGEQVDLSDLFVDVESRLDALENKEEVKDTNTYIDTVELSTENEGENGLFIVFTYNNGDKKVLNVTELEPKVYSQGVGILIGEDNVINIDEEWFNEWFDNKVSELAESLLLIEEEVSEIKGNVKTLSDSLAAISGRVDTNESEISTVKSNLTSALSQISSNLAAIKEAKAIAEEAKTKAVANETKVTTLAEKLAKIRGVEYIKAGSNVSVETSDDGIVTISANIPEFDASTLEAKINSEIERSLAQDETHSAAIAALRQDVDDFAAIEMPNLEPIVEAIDTVSGKVTTIENRLDDVEERVGENETNIIALQEALKNISPEGEALSGDGITIQTNDSGFLTVRISEDELNALRKNNDGLFVQSIEMVLGDDEINAEEK